MSIVASRIAPALFLLIGTLALGCAPSSDSEEAQAGGGQAQTLAPAHGKLACELHVARPSQPEGVKALTGSDTTSPEAESTSIRAVVPASEGVHSFSASVTEGDWLGPGNFQIDLSDETTGAPIARSLANKSMLSTDMQPVLTFFNNSRVDQAQLQCKLVY